MKFKAKNIGKGQGVWQVLFDNDEWNKILKSAEFEIINNLEIEGFRKGKVPIEYARNNGFITSSAINDKGIKIAIKKSYNFAIKQNSDIKPISSSTIKPSFKNLNNQLIIQLKFDSNIDIKLGKYKNLKIKKNKVIVTNDMINDEIKKYQNKTAIIENKKEGLLVETGDFVSIDFVGYIDNKEFKGGAAKDFILEIGSNKFIPGFEKALIGWKVKTTKDIDLKFPDNYPVVKYQGKDVRFNVSLKSIKTKIMPKLDNEFVEDLNISSVKTLEELKEYIKNSLNKQLKQKEHSRFIQELLDKVELSSEIFVPEIFISRLKKNLYEEFKVKLKQQNLTIGDYCKRTKLDLKFIDNELRKDAIKRLKDQFIIDKIKRNEKITVNKEEINNKYKELAKMFNIGNDLDKVKNLLSEDKIVNDILNNKVFNFLYNNNG